MRIEKQLKTGNVSGAIGVGGEQKQTAKKSDSFGTGDRAQYVKGMNPSGGTGALVAPELEQQLRDRLAELNNVLLAGTVTKKLERAIKAEIKRIERLLLAGVIAPSQATTALLSPDFERKVRARIKEID